MASSLISKRQRRIAVARGDSSADLVLKGGKVLSVFTGELVDADVAICDGVVVGLGDYEAPNEIDVTGKLLAPGFVDGHCHIESSKLSVHEFARAILRCGTTTVIVDPHELANVLGVAGIEYVLDASEGLPLDVRVMIPSCVPASPFESPLKVLAAGDFQHLIGHPRVLGLAEMMNYPAAIAGDKSTLEKMAAFRWEHIDGHAPSVTGRDLNAYITAGPSTDHECVSAEEALEKRRLGLWIMIREASMIRNLADLLPMVRQHGTENTLFCTDDREADTLLHEGHMNAMARRAVQLGLAAADAVKLASLNVARCHGLARIGAIAPSYRADINVFADLERFEPELVIAGGRVVSEKGSVRPFDRTENIPVAVRGTVRLGGVSEADFEVTAENTSEIRVIELVRDQVVTKLRTDRPTIRDGSLVADSDRDLAKLAVVERHNATGRLAVGFVRGFGLRRGAFASTIAHDAHNVVVAGVDDRDMLIAVRRIEQLGGGLVTAGGGQVLGEMPLSIAGLMSDMPAEHVDASLRKLDMILAELGVTLPTPFMYLGFLALSVIPELRLTDRGLVDVARFQLVPLAVA